MSIGVGLAIIGAYVAPSTSKARGAYPSRPRTGYEICIAKRREA